MYDFQTSYFFNLSNYRHSSLFSHSTFVWDALKHISLYLNSFKLGIIEAEVSPGAFLIDPENISIGKGSVVEAGAYIKGPCVIGDNCVIRHGAYIRGGLIAGDACVIGHATEVKDSIFLNHAYAAHFAYVGNSILGEGVNLGAGVKLANLNFNNKPVIIHFGDKRIETGMRKLGAVIGDKSQIGCNAVLNPGTLFGKNVNCYPSINVGGVIETNQVVRNFFNSKVVQNT
jgi:UDP-N-acetylglucosamine diphosphorylase / glucose-1-phosphate thymidylyltransferase / UDP-N-acetylgalactosamine diphosphorylase / glucosamine-1-phosphate N-acetyltransferase / galactosamine-1-phosphate N-acetyltransferase